ncbi:hypothetical protein DEO72_LG9g1999 [Vigna unguiculata]|uniref:Uncharacterized protein n=1 Tax=Vigna unguiculata TaxID=3917 RepID=A0A4D6N285_VIGUN|nr:hypothetical protein DEO72_LG9g1999 [Vigna unguiculata]
MERALLPRASFHRQLAGVPPRRCSSAATVPSRHHLLLASNSSLHAPSSSATAHEFPHHHLRPRPPRFCSTHHLLASAPTATRNHFRPHLHQLESTFRFTAAARSSRSLHLTQQPWLHHSPYLLVIGDDRVRDTREQMMLMQVVLVRLSLGAGITLDLASERG